MNRLDERDDSRATWGEAMINQLSETAELHALGEHRLQTPLSIADVENILKLEGRTGDVDALVPCYGAWFGRHAIDLFGGQWVGLTEPVAPRVLIGGLPYSPFDAVARRLRDVESPSLGVLLDRLAVCFAQVNLTECATRNLRRWTELAENSPFINRGWLPETPEEALHALDPWLQSEGVAGKKLLCLAAGGGTHAPLHALAGAHVTVVDFCDALLEIDRELALEKQLDVEAINCSMESLPGRFASYFDIVLQPVSMCYVADPQKVYAEIRRVMRPGGLYIVQHKSSTSLRTTDAQHRGYQLEFPQMEKQALPSGTPEYMHRETGTIEFAHSLECLIGTLCRCGFLIEDFSEPLRGDGWAAEGSLEHRALFAPPYLKIKARSK
jgi:2-polyprenyl-3-methyl-5-hydroxy-6-metoxy-1,4-benzoquinol methylase